MIYNLEISSAAENDLRAAFIYYENEVSGLGFKFKKQAEFTMNVITRNPLKVQIRYRDVRVAWLKKFPFGVHFSIDGSTIIILAIFHSSENPFKWQSRVDSIL